MYTSHVNDTLFEVRPGHEFIGFDVPAKNIEKAICKWRGDGLFSNAEITFTDGTKLKIESAKKGFAINMPDGSTFRSPSDFISRD